MAREKLDRIRLDPRLAAAVFIFVLAYVHQWIVMVQEQQHGGSSSVWQGPPRPPPTRDEVVELLRQVLPPGAPHPTDDEINFLTEQFKNLEPGTALSFNPSLLGRTGPGSVDSWGRPLLDVTFGPPPLAGSSSSSSFDGQESCGAVEDDVRLLKPTHRFQAVARSIPRMSVGQINDGVPQHDAPAESDDGMSRSSTSSGDRISEKVNSQKGDTLVGSMPPDLPARAGPSSSPPSSTTSSSKPFNHSSIRDALRKVKDQVRAVERLRSSMIELEENESSLTVARSGPPR